MIHHFFTFILLVWLSIMSDFAARIFLINSVLIWFLDYQPYQYGSMLTLNRYGSLADLKKAYDAKKKREKASFGSRLAASCQHLATGTTQKLFNKLTISSKWSFDQMLKCRRSKFKVTLEFSNKISKKNNVRLYFGFHYDLSDINDSIGIFLRLNQIISADQVGCSVTVWALNRFECVWKIVRFS